MRKRIFTGLLLVFFALCNGCGSSEGLTKRQIEKINAEETYPSSMASLVKVFDSVEELYEDAELVAEVKVQSTEVILPDDLPQTISTLQVMDVIKGDGGTGIITVREEGGIVAGMDVCWGVPVMEEGQHLVLFLVDSGMGVENEYCVLGAYQGKFVERQGYFFQQATEDVKLSPKQYSPGKIETLKRVASENK